MSSRAQALRRSSSSDWAPVVFFGNRVLSKLVHQIKLAHVLSGDTCSPIGLQEFEAYLAFIEQNLEHLQYIVWFQDYKTRFDALPDDIQRQSPAPQGPSSFLDNSFKATEFVRPEKSRTYSNDSTIPPRDSLTYAMTSAVSPSFSNTPLTELSPSSTNNDEFSPLTVPHRTDPHNQPFRNETLSIVATFFRPGSPKMLPVDQDVRDCLLETLAWTTHPDAFMPTYRVIYDHLEKHSLPRFLAIQAANINLPRQMMWFAAGAAQSCAGLVVALGTVYKVHVPPQGNRAWRLFAVPLIAVGIVQMYGSSRGFCMWVLRRNARQLRSWELEDPEEAGVRLTMAWSQPTDVAPPAEDREGDFGADKNSLPENGGGDSHSVNILYSASETSGGDIRRILIRRPHRKPHSSRNGYNRPPVFGPEAVVEDSHIKNAHQQILTEVTRLGILCVLVFTAILLSVPTPH